MSLHRNDGGEENVGREMGVPSRANAMLTDIVKRVERGELKPDPRHITGLRVN